MKAIDEEVLVPVNLGALGSIKGSEASGALTPWGSAVSMREQRTCRCSMIREALLWPVRRPIQFHGESGSHSAVAKHLGITTTIIETQREFVGSRLGTNVMTLMDLLACHPTVALRFSPGNWISSR